MGKGRQHLISVDYVLEISHWTPEIKTILTRWHCLESLPTLLSFLMWIEAFCLAFPLFPLPPLLLMTSLTAFLFFAAFTSHSLITLCTALLKWASQEQAPAWFLCGSHLTCGTMLGTHYLLNKVKENLPALQCRENPQKGRTWRDPHHQVFTKNSAYRRQSGNQES